MFKIVKGQVYPVCKCGEIMIGGVVLDCYPAYESYDCPKGCKHSFGASEPFFFPMTVSKFYKYIVRNLHAQQPYFRLTFKTVF
jgi:hypothetical protein